MPHLTTRDASPWLVLVIVCFAQFMVVLDATISNVALPSIQADLGFSAANLQWVVNGYTLLFGGFLLLGGRAAHQIGGALGLAVLSTLAADRTAAALADLGQAPSLAETNVALVDGSRSPTSPPPGC